MNYKRGNIVLLPFPYADLSSSKKRPALILSNNSFNKNSSDVLCCLITTNPKLDKYSFSIDEKDVAHGSLHYKSTIKPYRLFTTDKRLIIKKLCGLKKSKFNKAVKILVRLVSKM